MRADFICEIVEKYIKSDSLPYKTILFDGAWGIGKSYAVNNALKGKDNVCFISMFGLKDASQIYHELLFQFAFNNVTAGKITQNFWDGLSIISEKVDKAKGVVESQLKEKDLFRVMSNRFTKPHIVVIDDLERVSNSVSLEEVLGIVEELRACSFVRVILVACLEELKQDNKVIFDKYNEKVIDRIYYITERPREVNWPQLNISADFIKDFLEIHNVKNLRTLIKAQNFYKDVELHCSSITDVCFQNEVRLICFAVVVESIDNLYYEPQNDEEKDSMKRYMSSVHNDLINRICRYLSGIKSSRSLVEIILQYYENKKNIDDKSINAEYKIFLKSGDVPNYYKSDDQIKAILPELKNGLSVSENIVDLSRFADEYIIWSDTINVDNSNILEEYKIKLHIMLEKVLEAGEDRYLFYGGDLLNLSSSKILDIYEQEVNLMKKTIVNKYIDYLCNRTKGEKAFEYSYKLKEYSNNIYFREIIEENIEKL